MKPITKLMIPALTLLFALTPMALPQGRWDRDRDYGYGRIDNRDEAYRAGHNQGYREGVRQGRNDYRAGRRFDDRFRDKDFDRWSSGYNSPFRNDFRKGFRQGFREGYREGFPGRGRGNHGYRFW